MRENTYTPKPDLYPLKPSWAGKFELSEWNESE